MHDSRIDLHAMLSNEVRNRGIAQIRYMEGGHADAWTIWQSEKSPPSTPLEMITYAEALAERGDEGAIPFLNTLHEDFPIEAEILLARLRLREDGSIRAWRSLRGLREVSNESWVVPVVMRRAIGLAVDMAQSPNFAQVGGRSTPRSNSRSRSACSTSSESRRCCSLRKNSRTEAARRIS
jgi:hypothetical protein